MFDSLTVYVLAVIFIATLIRSTLGFGEALVAVPLLALRTPITVAAPLAVLVSVLVAAVIVAQDWRHVRIRSATGLIISSLFGIPLGVLLLIKVDGHLVKLLLGVMIVAFSIYSLSAKTKLHLHKDHWGWLIGCGFLSGVLGGAYGMNGPPLVVYGALRKWSPQHFRATLQGYFLPVSLIGLLGYLAVGVWNATVTRYFLLSLPEVAVAILLGRIINHRMKDHGFFRIVYAGLIVIGTVLVIQAASTVHDEAGTEVTHPGKHRGLAVRGMGSNEYAGLSKLESMQWQNQNGKEQHDETGHVGRDDRGMVSAFVLQALNAAGVIVERGPGPYVVGLGLLLAISGFQFALLVLPPLSSPEA